MDISLDKSTGQYQIKSYQEGRILINGNHYSQPVMVSLDQLHLEKLPHNIHDIDKSMLKTLQIDQFEAVLVGTGKNMELLSWEILEAAQMMGVPLEVMSTGAACRTFTILASEGRQVLAILYP